MAVNVRGCFVGSQTAPGVGSYTQYGSAAR